MSEYRQIASAPPLPRGENSEPVSWLQVSDCGRSPSLEPECFKEAPWSTQLRVIVLSSARVRFALTFARADDPAGNPTANEISPVAAKAIAYLRAHQGEDGSFSPRLAGPGVSAVVATGLLRNGLSLNDPMMAKLMAYLEKSVKADGGVYDKALANYTTSVALMAFTEAPTLITDTTRSSVKP